MTEILALLQNIAPLLEPMTFRQMSQIIFAMLVMSGRITMLGLSRWADKGGSYRTIQHWYHTKLPWEALHWLFFVGCLLREHAYILAGDEVVIGKAGTETHSLDRFFSGLQKQGIPGLSFFVFSLVDLEEEHSYPLEMNQVVKSAEEKADSKAKKEARKSKKATEKRKPRRPKGSKNKLKSDKVELNLELLRIEKALKTLLETVEKVFLLTYVVLDGHFGNYPSVFMLRNANLHLISKMRADVAFYPPFDGEYAGRERPAKYGKKLDVRSMDEKYLKATTVKDNLRTEIYQGTFYNRIRLRLECGHPLEN